MVHLEKIEGQWRVVENQGATNNGNQNASETENQSAADTGNQSNSETDD